MNFEKYADMAINMPLLFLYKNGSYLKTEGKTFKEFMQGKLLTEKKENPNIKDFENHLATIFTEVRLKKYIEIRSLDTCEWDCHCSGPAFYTGLLYGNLDAALEIINKWNISDTLNAYIESPKKGFETMLANKTLLEWSKIFLDLAKKGLIERNKVNSKGKNETVYLKHVENVVNNKKNRAQLLLEKYNKTKNLDFFKNEKENFNYSGF